MHPDMNDNLPPKPNCYACKWRGEIPGDCHSCCNHPALLAGDGAIKWIECQAFLVSGRSALFNLTANAYGIRNGWFAWPINFDPIWLETCDGFEKKEDMNTQKSGDFDVAVSPTNAASATNTTNP